MRLVQASHFWVKELWNWSNWVTKELVESKVKKDQNDSWCWCFCIGILNGKWKRQLNIQKCVCVCSDCVCSHSVVSGPLRPHGLYSVGFLRPEYWSGLPFLPPGDLPDSGIEPTSSLALALQGDSSPLSLMRSPKYLIEGKLNILRLGYIYWVRKQCFLFWFRAYQFSSIPHLSSDAWQILLEK